MADVSHHPEKVEIKANTYGVHAKTAADAFHLTPNNGDPRRIWFCESRRGLRHGRLDLLENGLILRLRAIADDPDDTTVKLRGQLAPILPDPWLQHFQIEGDWAGEQHLISASFTEKVASGRIKEAVAEGGSISRAFTAEQEDYLRHDSHPQVHMSELKCLGPIQGVKWSKLENDHFPYHLRAERWKIDELHFLEFSMLVDWDEAEKAQLRLDRFLTKRRVDLSGQQLPKTTLVLRHLARITS
jgi:hypothetical protein